MERNPAQRYQTSLRQKFALIILGICLFFILLETGLRLGGFIILSWQEYRNLQSIKQKGAYRIMCLGESTTMNQYPPYLEEILNQKNIGIKFSVIDKGQVGIQTHIILEELESNLDRYCPDMAVAMIGINDSGEPLSYETLFHPKPALIFRSLRTYKLMGLLLLRCATMAKQRGIFRFKNKKPHVSDLQFSSEFTLQSIHTKQTDFFSAEDSLKKAIAINSTNDETYAELGLLYRTYSYFSQAEEPLKKAIALNPLNDKAYVELGIVYLNLGKNSDAGTLFQKATMLNPKNEQAYYELGGFYLGQGNLSLAEDSLKKAIALNPVNANAYVDLIETYLRQNRLSEAEETYSKAIKFADDNDRLQGVVKVISNAFGNHKLAQKYFEKADELRTKYYLPSVVNNYRKIGEILIQRKIKLVCVQYPMRNIEPLKRIFEDKEGIIFVDNEKLFKDAVRREGYWGYFTDMYGGDFGHCTEKGNRLLAENIANVIIKEVFYK